MRHKARVTNIPSFVHMIHRLTSGMTTTQNGNSSSTRPSYIEQEESLKETKDYNVIAGLISMPKYHGMTHRPVFAKGQIGRLLLQRLRHGPQIISIPQYLQPLHLEWGSRLLPTQKPVLRLLSYIVHLSCIHLREEFASEETSTTPDGARG